MEILTKEWLRATLVRMLRTFAESMLAYIGTGALILSDVSWIAALSAGAMGAIIALLLAFAGLPEVKRTEIEYNPVITEEDHENAR